MNNKQLREKVLNEAIRIGDWLLSVAKTDENGIYWEFMNMDDARNITWDKADGIYSGVCGEVLLFMELHKITGEEKYKTAAVAGMRWTTKRCLETENAYAAFFTGRMGVPYTLLQMAEYYGDGEDQWTEKALKIAANCRPFTGGNRNVDDLINGNAGILVALLHLHAKTGADWILESIEEVATHLVKAAHQGKQGLYWDRSSKNITGLCGFSHGAAGVGYAFLELGRYFNNPTLYNIARLAFYYESQHYSQETKNWQDLRKGIYTEEDTLEHTKNYREGNLEFFTKGGNMNAWCHGAAGIALSRLRAMEILKNDLSEDEYEIYKKEAIQAVETTKLYDLDGDSSIPLFILCHGIGGNAEAFINAYLLLKDEKYLTMAEKAAEKALAFQEKHHRYPAGFRDAEGNEDTSLFMGSAGVAYFYLRLLEPEKVPSILCPSLTQKATDETINGLPTHWLLRGDNAIPAKLLLHRYYERTLLLLESLVPEKVTEYLNTAGLSRYDAPLKHTFAQLVEKIMPTLPKDTQTCLHDLFVLEFEKIKMDEAQISDCHMSIRDELYSKRAQELLEQPETAFLNMQFKLEPQVILSGTDWDWSAANKENWTQNPDLEPDMYPILLKPTPFGTIENAISPMTYTILGEFDQGNTVAAVEQATLDAFEDLTPEDIEMLKEKIREQIKQLLLAGILVETDAL